MGVTIYDLPPELIQQILGWMPLEAKQLRTLASVSKAVFGRALLSFGCGCDLVRRHLLPGTGDKVWDTCDGLGLRGSAFRDLPTAVRAAVLAILLAAPPWPHADDDDTTVDTNRMFFERWRMNPEMAEITFNVLLDHNIDLTLQQNRAFRWAARAGYLNVVKRLTLLPGVDPADDDNYAIKCASETGELEVVKLLLADARVDPTAEDDIALQYACDFSRTEVVKLLLADPRVNPACSDNYPLVRTCTVGNVEIMDALLNTGKVDPSFNNNNAIRVCCNHGHLSLLERLLQDPRTDPSVLNNSPVRLAAQNGYLEIVQFLAKDPRVTLSDSDSSALALACEHGQEEVVEFLLQEGSSDPTAFDNANLIDSVRFGNWNIVELLIEDGRVNIESHEYLVVTNAVDERRQDIINLILTRYSSTTHPILELLQSVIELDTSRLQEFLENDHYDHTLHIGGLAALLLAIEAGNIPIIKLLLSDSRVDPFTFDGECRALTYACHSGKMDVVKTLLEDKRIKPTQQVVYTTCLVLQFEVARELLRHECFVGRVTWDLDATDDELLVYVANMKQE